MAKVITIGEMLIDFLPTQKGSALSEVLQFERKPGGAPANVAACVSRLGGVAKFVGKLGDDPFGSYLLDVLKEENINIDDVFLTKDANTALAFVSLEDSGERDFMFYRNPSADMLLKQAEINPDIFEAGDILHFCSLGLVEAPTKYAHLKAIECAKEKGTTISFDPNIRLSLWEDEAECRNTIKTFITHVNILKLSTDELTFITGISDEQLALEKILEINPDLQWLILTKGSKGVVAIVNDKYYQVPGYNVTTIDTTGAGDSYIGAVLYCLANKTTNDPIQILRFANAVGALTTTKIGAISAIPLKTDVELFIQENQIMND